MKYGIILAAATAVLLATTACSGGTPSTGAHPGSSASAGSSSSGGGSASGGGDASRFCTLARSIGHTDLGVSSGNLDPDTKQLLKQVDQLDALAPQDIKSDFDRFKAFEYSVLEPGNANAPKVTGDPSAALKHVGTYFVDTCHVN